MEACPFCEERFDVEALGCEGCAEERYKRLPTRLDARPKRGRGRPPLPADEVRDLRIRVYATAAEAEAIEAAAAATLDAKGRPTTASAYVLAAALARVKRAAKRAEAARPREGE